VAAVVAESAPGQQYAPLRIQIPAIGASAPVDPLGLNRDGTLEVPADFARAGYYTGRPPPGAIGPAIIVAHVDSKTGPAVFARLRDLKPGDEVTVTRADRSDVVFVIDRIESHPKNAFPTNAVYDPTPGATLRLITCGGSFDRRAGHYRDNVIAFAHFKSVTPTATAA
jgi:sortase (surface protein transpeptidase)